MAIKKGLLYSTNNPDGLYPYSQTDCIFDESTEQGLDGILSDLQTLVSSLSTNKQDVLTAGTRISISNNTINADNQLGNGNYYSSVDMNDFVMPGVYSIGSISANGPGSINGVLFVLGYREPRAVRQFLFRQGTQNVTDFYWYYRNVTVDTTTGKASTAGDWIQIENSRTARYNAGNTVSNIGSQYPTVMGMCTNVNQIEIVIPLNKSVSASSVSFSNLTIKVWNATGTIIIDAINVVADTSYTVTSSVIDDVGIKVVVKKNGIFPGSGIALPVNIRPGTSFTFA